jgi:hypothetical protein
MLIVNNIGGRILCQEIDDVFENRLMLSGNRGLYFFQTLVVFEYM